MSVSIDVSQLEVVKTFSGFLQIMQEPEKYKDLLKETDRLINEQRKLLGPVQTKEQADAYLVAAQNKISVWAKEDESRQAETEKKYQDKMNQANSALETAQGLRAKAQEATDNANQKVKDADTALSNAKKLEASAQVQKNSLDKQQEELNEKKVTLDEKLEKVRKMLGE